MPQRADGVVPVEDVERISNGHVHILRSTSPGRFIAKRGSDVRAGSVVLKRGTKLGPAQLAVAASVGAATVKVFAACGVAILATGDELVPASATPQAAQIRNSNNIMLASLLRRMNCDVRDLGVAPDDPQKIRDAIVAALKDADVLFITGGMSMGEHDYVPRILLDLKVDLRITKLRIKPGKPFLFGVHQNRFIFGLPGNPVSGFACVVRLASRLLARLAGGEPKENWIAANLTSALDANGPREFYQPAILEEHGVTPLAWKGSADIYTLASANALLVRPENDPPRTIGESVKILPLNYA
jgi:molybdopterin molybdotransferase